MARLLPWFLLILLQGCGVPRGVAPVSSLTTRVINAMDENDEILHELARLEDRVYFQQPSQLPEPLRSTVLGISIGAVCLGAPVNTNLAKQDSLPLLLVMGDTDARSELVSSVRNTALIAVDLERGAAQSVAAFPVDPTKTTKPRPAAETPRVLPPDFGNPLEREPGPGGRRRRRPTPDSITQTWLDARALGALEWVSGRHALRVLELDRFSNSAVVTLVDPAGPAPVAGVPADIAFEIEQRARRANAIPAGLGNFLRGVKTPALPGPGAAFTLDAEIHVGARTVPFHGAARLTFGEGMRVDPELFEVEPEAGIEEEDLPQAIIPVNVLIAELDVVPPRMVEVMIPYTGEWPLETGSHVDVAFSLDLAEALGSPLQTGTYFVYLIAGEHMAGPRRLDVVGE